MLFLCFKLLASFARFSFDDRHSFEFDDPADLSRNVVLRYSIDFGPKSPIEIPTNPTAKRCPFVSLL